MGGQDESLLLNNSTNLTPPAVGSTSVINENTIMVGGRYIAV